MGYVEELKSLERPDGSLLPEDVVEFARDPNTALHSRFTWDDGEAAAQYRLWQARQIIRVVVREVPNTEAREPVRAYVSLESDRTNGGGYRTLTSVMSDDDRRAELLLQAKRDARLFASRYRVLQEMAKVIEEIENAVSG
jgi:hypothetical protein